MSIGLNSLYNQVGSYAPLRPLTQTSTPDSVFASDAPSQADAPPPTSTGSSDGSSDKPASGVLQPLSLDSLLGVQGVDHTASASDQWSQFYKIFQDAAKNAPQTNLATLDPNAASSLVAKFA
jgi:hypothetical protein